MGYKVGVEVGVYKGDFTKQLCDEGLKMYGIDPWLAYKNYDDVEHKGLGGFQKRQDFLYEHTKRTLKTHLDSGLCELVRKTSMDAVDDFPDGSLDFVYIDGHHGFRYIAEDLCEWSQKVRKGGVISGHDYAINKKGARDPNVIQVRYVLHAFTDAFHIQNWFVLGSDKPEGERTLTGRTGGCYHDVYTFGDRKEKRDRWRSWMWVRNE